MRRPRASVSVYPKSRSAPGFQPTTRPPRSTVTIATGLVSTIASAYCFRRWISRKSPALWIARTDWVAKAWRVATTSGAKAASSRRMMTRPPSSCSSRMSGTARSERVPFPGVDGPDMRRDELPLLLGVRDLHRLSAHPGPTDGPLAEPDRRGPHHFQVLRRDAVRGPRVEALGGLVELVDDPAVAARELDGPADDRLEHGLEVERGTDRLADLAERPELADRSRQIPRPRLQLLNSRTFSMAMTA